MKIFKKLLLASAALVVLLFVASWGVSRRWGRDVERLRVAEGPRRFEAQRNAAGVWKLTAPEPESLWFAFGYIHSFDREFQMELLRQLALGRLSAWFGPSQVARDRLMRMLARAARADWEALPADSPLRRAAESYVAGRRARLREWPDRLPVEFRVFDLKREDVADWEPWHVLAVSRLQTWEFSYDLLEEIRAQGLRKNLGPELTALLAPAEPKDSDELLYRQVDARAKLNFPASGAWPAMWAPKPDQVAALSEPSAAVPAQGFPWGDTALGAELGASNAWIVANPRVDQAPTLCNDTHLGFSWPAPLYPIEYSLGTGAHGRGYMLPGLPAIVIGSVDNGERSLAWGITLGSYADTQDLVTLAQPTLARAARVKETFRVRDPQTHQISEQSFTEEWTSFGPRVDAVVDWKGANPGVPVALDWIGFRRVPTPLEFYIRRNLDGAAGLREDLARGWMFPAVNFTWIERAPDTGTRFGHLLTGLIFDRARTAPRRLLSEPEARARKLSRPVDRPYLDFAYDAKAPFLAVTGNQAVFPGATGERLGYEWTDRARARLILSDRDDLFRRAEHAQTDYRSGALLDFVRTARGQVPADRLCAEQNVASCLELVSALDRWDGNALATNWEPTLAALWYSKVKQKLWPERAAAEAADLFVGWHRSNGSMRAVANLLHEPAARAAWQKLTRREWNETLADAFRESLTLLVSELGPLSSGWEWGRVHHIEWQHPVRFAPEPLGTLLAGSLFGPPPAVSGTLDSPGRFDFQWDPKAPVDFPARHGAAMRMCVTLTPKGPSQMRWTAATGVSGNPFSKWAWPFASEYYYKDQLLTQ